MDWHQHPDAPSGGAIAQLTRREIAVRRDEALDRRRAQVERHRIDIAEQQACADARHDSAGCEEV